MFIISRLLLGLGIPFSVIAASSLIGGKVTAVHLNLSTPVTHYHTQNFPIRRNALVWVPSSPPPGILVPPSSPVSPSGPSAATTLGVGGYLPYFSSYPVPSNSRSSGGFQSLPDGSFRRADARKRWPFSSSIMLRGRYTVPLPSGVFGC